MSIKIPKDIYTDCSVTVNLHQECEKIRIEGVVRQGDTISAKLFKLDGEFLSNLRFADDIFICKETPQELQQMLQELLYNTLFSQDEIFREK